MMRNLHPGARWTFRLSTYWLFFAILFVVGITALTYLLESDSELKYFSNAGMSFLIILILAIVFGEIYSRLAYQFWKYDFTNTELKIEQGIIWKKYKSIPYQRVQNVEIQRGLIARIFGYSTIAIHTAGYSAPAYQGWWGMGARGAEGYIPGVSIEEGDKIRQFIMSKIGKRSGM